MHFYQCLHSTHSYTYIHIYIHIHTGVQSRRRAACTTWLPLNVARLNILNISIFNCN